MALTAPTPPLGYVVGGQTWHADVLLVTQYRPLICPTCHRKQPSRHYPPRCLFADCPTNSREAL